MPIQSFWTDTITIIRPGTKISRGSTVPDWDASKTHSVSGCLIQPQSSTLDQGGRLAVSESMSALLPPQADVIEGDRIIFDDAVFVIDGAPLPSKSPSGQISHIRLSLKRWSG
jgi:hypothetical protein